MTMVRLATPNVEYNSLHYKQVRVTNPN